MKTVQYYTMQIRTIVDGKVVSEKLSVFQLFQEYQIVKKLRDILHINGEFQAAYPPSPFQVCSPSSSYASDSPFNNSQSLDLSNGAIATVSTVQNMRMSLMQVLLSLPLFGQ